MKIKILVIEIRINNIRSIRRYVKPNDVEILYASSFLDVVDIIHLQRVHIIVFSDFRGIESTVGYIKMFKATNPDFILILLSNNKKINLELESYYVQRGADSLISCYDIEGINSRLYYHYENFIEDRSVRNDWSICTKKAIRYLKNNYHKSSNLLDCISVNIDYSVSSIIHSVKRDTGFSVSDWVQKLRVNGAIELLRSTEYPVKLISNQVGYRSIQGLMKAFRKVTGKTPVYFRRENE